MPTRSPMGRHHHSRTDGGAFSELLLLKTHFLESTLKAKTRGSLLQYPMGLRSACPRQSVDCALASTTRSAGHRLQCNGNAKWNGAQWNGAQQDDGMLPAVTSRRAVGRRVAVALLSQRFHRTLSHLKIKANGLFGGSRATLSSPVARQKRKVLLRSHFISDPSHVHLHVWYGSHDPTSGRARPNWHRGVGQQGGWMAEGAPFSQGSLLCGVTRRHIRPTHVYLYFATRGNDFIFPTRGWARQGAQTSVASRCERVFHSSSCWSHISSAGARDLVRVWYCST